MRFLLQRHGFSLHQALASSGFERSRNLRSGSGDDSMCLGGYWATKTANMKIQFPCLLLLIGCFAASATGFSASADDARGPADQITKSTEPLLRERRKVSVNGHVETWELRWSSPPHEVCTAADNYFAGPCSGFAYGQAGPLYLVRKWRGREIDKLDLRIPRPSNNLDELSDFDSPEGIYQPSVMLHAVESSDWERHERHDPTLAADIAKRPLVQVMNLADYNHDGAATEFLFQVGTLPSTRRMMVLIGVSADNPKLHAFSVAETAPDAFVAVRGAWESLRQSKGSTAIIEWACFDHGSETQTTLHIWTTNGLLHATRTVTPCPDLPD